MRYNLSYTAASLRIHDTLLVANAMLSDEDSFEDVDLQIGNGKRATGLRVRQELVKRLSKLTPQQLEHLAVANLDDAYKLAFLSICKTYDYIHQFVVEVLRQKMFEFDYVISDGEYLSYYNRKAEMHSELEELSDTSNYKIKQVLFKMLEEAGYIDSVRNKILQPQFISPVVEKLIRADDKQLLRIFFYSEADVLKSPYL